jgi:hypothetical protein
LPGDPGACEGAPDPFDLAPGPRGPIARAGRQLSMIAPLPVSSCAASTAHAAAPAPAVAAGALVCDPG